MLARLTGEADDLAQQYPRGHALLEDLPPAPIGPAIPNGRALLAAVIDAAGPSADLAHPVAVVTAEQITEALT